MCVCDGFGGRSEGSGGTGFTRGGARGGHAAPLTKIHGLGAMSTHLSIINPTPRSALLRPRLPPPKHVLLEKWPSDVVLPQLDRHISQDPFPPPLLPRRAVQFFSSVTFRFLARAPEPDRGLRELSEKFRSLSPLNRCWNYLTPVKRTQFVGFLMYFDLGLDSIMSEKSQPGRNILGIGWIKFNKKGSSHIDPW